MRAVPRTFHDASAVVIDQRAFGQRGFVVRAGVVDGVHFSVHAKKRDALVPERHAFAGALGKLAGSTRFFEWHGSQILAMSSSTPERCRCHYSEGMPRHPH